MFRCWFSKRVSQNSYPCYQSAWKDFSCFTSFALHYKLKSFVHISQAILLISKYQVRQTHFPGQLKSFGSQILSFFLPNFPCVYGKRILYDTRILVKLVIKLNSLKPSANRAKFNYLFTFLKLLKNIDEADGPSNHPLLDTEGLQNNQNTSIQRAKFARKCPILVV